MCFGGFCGCVLGCVWVVGNACERRLAGEGWLVFAISGLASWGFGAPRVLADLSRLDPRFSTSRFSVSILWSLGDLGKRCV